MQVYHYTREGNGTPLQYSCLENPTDEGAWKAAVHGVADGRTRLSDFTFTFHFHALEKEMATHSSVLAWRIPGTGEPGGLPSMGSHRVGHDWSDLAAAAAPPGKPVHLLYRKVYSSPLLIFFLLSLNYSSLYIFWIVIPYQIHDSQILLLFCGLPLHAPDSVVWWTKVFNLMSK